MTEIVMPVRDASLSLALASTGGGRTSQLLNSEWTHDAHVDAATLVSSITRCTLCCDWRTVQDVGV